MSFLITQSLFTIHYSRLSNTSPQPCLELFGASESSQLPDTLRVPLRGNEFLRNSRFAPPYRKFALLLGEGKVYQHVLLIFSGIVHETIAGGEAESVFE